METLDRREFIRKAGMAAAGLPLLPLAGFETDNGFHKSGELEVHIFSKHLQFLDWSEAAETAAKLGFAGLDLTVRPGGHVEPARAPEQLPAAVEAIRKSGSHCRLITTAVDDAKDPVDLGLLESAAKMGISHYRMNWFHYEQQIPMKESLEHYASEVEALARRNSELGLIGCYQNHAGKLVGSSMWELDALLRHADPASMGIQYDIRHAAVEAGLSWENGLQLVHTQIKTLALKDFKWVRTRGQWQVVNTPIGEGMVDFPRYFKLLKKYGVQVPASLHLEYPLGGAEHGDTKLNIDPDIVYKAMKKDLESVKRLWRKA